MSKGCPAQLLTPEDVKARFLWNVYTSSFYDRHRKKVLLEPSKCTLNYDAMTNTLGWKNNCFTFSHSDLTQVSAFEWQLDFKQDIDWIVHTRHPLKPLLIKSEKVYLIPEEKVTHLHTVLREVSQRGHLAANDTSGEAALTHSERSRLIGRRN